MTHETYINTLIDIGDMKGVEKIVRDGGMNYKRFNPLHYSIRKDNPVAVNILLSSGLDPNALDIYQRTPLITCIQLRGENMFDITQQLVTHGADIEKKGVYNDFTPLMMCLQHDQTPIMIEMIKYFIARGADLNTVCNGYTSLSTPGISLSVFELLLEAGANFNDDIIEHALLHPSSGRIELLIKHGLNVNRVIEGFDLSVIQILQDSVDFIVKRNPVFGLLEYVKEYNTKNSAITIQCCVRMYLSKIRADILRSTPTNLFDNEFSKIRFQMLKMEGF